ncbi:MAG: hypothetical protein K5776_12310, partial [Lachnospiraceae bacterium]|nr:hypothetical protein [Lachnospiraceae bacterium]
KLKSSKLIILIIILVVFFLMIAAVIVLGIFFFANKKDKKIQLGEFKEFNYSPGYGDMNGGYHYMTLCHDDQSGWYVECTDREEFDLPTVVTVYSVTDEEAASFERFIRESEIVGLQDRKDSDDFVTDYHSWSYTFIFDNTSVGGEKRAYYSFGQYQKYSDRDYELIKELDEKFEDLLKVKVSESIEEDE